MSKFEILGTDMRKLDVSPKEAIKYWLATEQIDCDFLKQIIDAQTTLPEDIFPHIRIGWYMFANGKFSPFADTYPQPVGVVAWMKPDLNPKAGERGLVILFDEFSGIWAESTLHFVGCDSPSDGAENTDKMVACLKSAKIDFPIAEFCEQIRNLYNGVAFLPAYKQLDKIAISNSVICKAFQDVGKKFHTILQSSTEVDDNTVICLDMKNSNIIHSNKTSLKHAYLIMKF